MQFSNSSRSFVRARAVSAVLALATALSVNLSACNAGPTVNQTPEQAAKIEAGKTVVATVAGAPVYRSEVLDAARVTGQIGSTDSLDSGSTVFSQILSEVIDQRLLAQSAKASGLDKTPAAKQRLAMARERILANMAVQSHIENRVTEPAAKALYDQQIKLRQTGEEARASHILVETEAQAKAAAKRLKAGEDFAAIATELSLDRGTQNTGGDLGYFQADAMVPAFSKAVFALKPGEVSDPFKSEFGWHIATLTDLRAAPAPGFDAMKPEIINFLTMDEIGKLIADLRENTEIVMTDLPADTPASDGNPANSETAAETAPDTDIVSPQNDE